MPKYFCLPMGFGGLADAFAIQIHYAGIVPVIANRGDDGVEGLSAAFCENRPCPFDVGIDVSNYANMSGPDMPDGPNVQYGRTLVAANLFEWTIWLFFEPQFAHVAEDNIQSAAR